MKKRKIHYYCSVGLDGNTYSACRKWQYKVTFMNTDEEIERMWHSVFGLKKQVTCKNCKRTRAFREG